MDVRSSTDVGQQAIVPALETCFAVKKRAVSPEFARNKLLRSSLLHTLDALGVDTAVCEALAMLGRNYPPNRS